MLTVEQATPFDRNELGMTSGGIVQGMGDQEVPKIWKESKNKSVGQSRQQKKKKRTRKDLQT